MACSGEAPLTCNFTAAPGGGGGAYTYLWDFGTGGATSTLQNPTFVYTDPGMYAVTCTMTDRCLNQIVRGLIVTVTEDTVPIVCDCPQCPAGAPERWRVTFPEFAPGLAGECCEYFSGRTFILEQVTACQWRWAATDDVCGGGNQYVTLNYTGDAWELGISTAIIGAAPMWDKSPETFNCIGTNVMSFFTGDPEECDWPATVTVEPDGAIVGTC